MQDNSTEAVSPINEQAIMRSISGQPQATGSTDPPEPRDTEHELVLERNQQTQVCWRAEGESVDLRAIRFGDLAEAYREEGRSREATRLLRLLGEYLRSLRKERYMSRELLACLIGVSRDDIFALEHGLLSLAEANEVMKGRGREYLEALCSEEYLNSERVHTESREGVTHT